MSKHDTEAVELVIENWNQAWRTKDASLGAKDYADDAEWMNAFGQKGEGQR